MFQKLQKKIKEFIEEKGQGVVEYAMVLGFVAIIAIWLLKTSNLNTTIEDNVKDVTAAGNAIHTAYTEAAK